MTFLSTARPRLSAAVYDPFLALGERCGRSDHRRTLLAGAAGRVLEIGAGTGANLTAYPPALDVLVVTEPDPGMARRLERKAARHRPDARVLRVEAAALPFPDGAFDVVLALFSLKEWPDRQRGVAECARVARPGGRLLLAELHASAPRAAWQRVLDHSRLPHPLASAFVTATLRPVVRHGVSTQEVQRLLGLPGLTAAHVAADPELAVVWARAERAA